MGDPWGSMALFASLFHLDGHHDSCQATQTVSPEDSDPSLSMIGTTLEFIRIYLDGGLRLLMGGSLDDGTASKVVFPPGNQAPVDSIAFTSGAVTMLLVNVEEERIFRDADPYRRINDEGRFHEVSHLKEWELAQEWIKKYKTETQSLFVKSAPNPSQVWLTAQIKKIA